jgi:hypothetical protein
MDQLAGLLLAGLGVFVCGLMSRDAHDCYQTQQWPAVQCEITASAVREIGGERPYRFEPRYRYEWQAQKFAGGAYRTKDGGSDDIAEAERLTRIYPVGAKRTCYVNPEQPTEAVLEREELWLYFAVVPLFALVFAWVVKLFLLAPRGKNAQPFGELTLGPRETTVAIVLLVLGAGGFLVWGFVLPLCKSVSARAWTPVPCVVDASTVRSKTIHGEVHVVLFWPDIVYRYRFNGQDYRANTYNFTDLSSPWYYGKRGIADQYPAGAKVTCHVNPRDPSQAVLTLHPSGTLWFGILPLVISVLGVLGLVEVTRKKELRFGSGGKWSRACLAIATFFALQIFLTTGLDLQRDWRAGVAEWPEFLVVAVAGIVSVVLSVCLLRSLVRWSLAS